MSLNFAMKLWIRRNTVKEREAMLKKAMDLEKQNLEDEKKNAAESLRILEAKAKQENDISDETMNAIAAARAKMYDAETAYYDGTKRLNQQLLTAQKEMRDEEAAKSKKQRIKRKPMRKNVLQNVTSVVMMSLKN